jgi:hypothetical protein
MIKMLIMSNFNGAGTAEQKAEYAAYLATKTDLELQNMVMINF